MSSIRILIIEDELIIAQDLAEILRMNGYEVCSITKSFEEGVAALTNLNPDIVLLDIQIKGSKDGVDLAETIRKEFHVPFVFISSHTDNLTLERVKKTNPYGFLVKPFEEDDVRVAIEIALENYSTEQDKASHGQEFVINQSLFVRHKNLSVKVRYDEILFCLADANYCTLFTMDQKFVLRSTLKELESKLEDKRFYRSHRSYLINLEKITAINSEIVHIGEHKLPIGREQLGWLMQHITKA